MNRKALVLILLVCGLWVVAQSASASVFTAPMTNDGLPDIIQDNSVALSILDTNSTGFVDAGDVIAGVIRWNNNITTPANFAATTVAIFSAQILTGPTSAGTLNTKPLLSFSLGAPSVPALTLAGLLPNQSAANGVFAAGNGTTAAGTIGAIFSLSGGADLTNGTFSAALGSIDTLANGWALDLTFGINNTVAGKNLAGATDFFESRLVDWNGDGKISNTEYASSPGFPPFPGTQVGQEAAAFSALILKTISSLVPVTNSDLNGANMTSDILLLNNTQLNVATATQAGLGYQFADNATAELNPLPEPASLAVWAGVLLIGGFSLRRRLRRA